MSVIDKSKTAENEFRAKLAGMELKESAEKAVEVSEATKKHAEVVAKRFKEKQDKILKAAKNGE